MWTHFRQYLTNRTSLNKRAYRAAGMYQRLLPKEMRPMRKSMRNVAHTSKINFCGIKKSKKQKEKPCGFSETGIIPAPLEAATDMSLRLQRHGHSEMTERLQRHAELSLRLQTMTEMLLRLQKHQKVILRLQKQQKRILPLQDPRLQESLRRSISVMTQ